MTPIMIFLRLFVFELRQHDNTEIDRQTSRTRNTAYQNGRLMITPNVLKNNKCSSILQI